MSNIPPQPPPPGPGTVFHNPAPFVIPDSPWGGKPALGQVSKYDLLTLSKKDGETLSGCSALGIGSRQQLKTQKKIYEQQYDPIDLHTSFGDALGRSIVSRLGNSYPEIPCPRSFIAANALKTAFSEKWENASAASQTQWKGTLEGNALKHGDREEMTCDELVNRLGTITLSTDAGETTLDYTLDKMTEANLDKVRETVKSLPSQSG